MIPVSFVFLISTLSALDLPSSVFAYLLRVNTYAGTDTESQNGVDIGVINRLTGAAAIKQYFGLPPTNVYFFFTDTAMPLGSSFKVCAFYHGTTMLINCNNFLVGSSNGEYTTLNLNPS